MPKKRTKKKRKQLTRRLYIAIFSLAVLLLVIIGGGIVYAVVITDQLPPLEQFRSRKVSESTKIYDRTGEVLLYEVFGEEKRTVLSFEDIPDIVKKATLTAEDNDFYNQPAFDWKGIVRAFLVNLKEGRISQGGSTITQQLVKNVFLTPERTITRKVKELILAIELESRYTKDEIFSAYLNQIPYGSNAYGIEAASQKYFGKSAVELTLAEATTLASLVRAPSYYSPWGNQQDELLARKDIMLDRMAELGHISQEELEEAKNQTLEFAPQNLGTIKAPHFSLAVRNYLINKYGEDTVLNGGLRVITTLDWELQQLAEETIAAGAERNEELYGGTNAALVAQDPTTGQILALVGSRNYFDEDIDGNFNVALQGLRQPGSALKPFAYLTAFEKGFQPETVVFDTLTEFVSGNPNCPAIVTPASSVNEECFNPENFDGIFRGPVSLQESLAQSINVPSVKTLYLAGFDDTLKTLHDFGISTLQERWRYGLSLVLGGGEVKLADLVNAYGTLSQEGIYRDQALVLKIERNGGETLEEFKNNEERVFDAQPVRAINQILSDRTLRAGLFQSSLNMTVFPGYEVALKTGTTNDYRDAWSLGYTPSLVVGVWAGNNNNDPMHRQGSSILAAVPMWSEFMNKAFETGKFAPEVFTRPESEAVTNKPMLNGNPFFMPVISGQTYPQLHSILYWVDKADPLGPQPQNPARDSQFYIWEESAIHWAQQNISGFQDYNKPLPQNVSFDEVSTKNISVSFTSPQSGGYIQQPLIVQATLRATKGLQTVELYFNHERIQTLPIGGNIYNYIYYINQPTQAQNTIELRVTDQQGNQESGSVVVFSR